MSHKDYHSPHGFKNETWRQIAVFFFAVLGVLYFWGHGNYGLFDVDEAIFTQATVEMVEHNNYVMPTYNGEPRYHKPPLIYWLQALSLQAFDAVPYQEHITPFAARLPSALAGMLAVILFYIFVDGMTKRPRYALTAASVFGLNLSWFIIVRAATADAALNMLILTSTMYMLWLLYTRRNSFVLQIIAGVLLGLGLLAKGPVAGVVPFVAVGLAGLLLPGFFMNLRVLNPFVILGAMLLTIAPWVVLIIQESGFDFFKEFIFVHNLARFESGLNNTHSSSGIYYVLVFLVGFFPWSFLFLAAVPWVFSRISEDSRSTDAAKVLPLIGMVWCFAIIGLFSFSQTKLAHYIVPALPGAALVIAGWVDQVAIRRYRQIIWFAMPVLIVLVAFFGLFNRLLMAARPGVVDPLINLLSKTFQFDWPLDKQPVADMLAQTLPLNIAPPVMAVVLLVGTFAGISVLRKGFRHGMMPLVMTQYGFLALIVVGLMPVVDSYVQQPLAKLAVHIKEEAEGSTVYHLGLHQPSVRLISQTSFTEVSVPAQLDGKLEDQRTLVLYEAHRSLEVASIFPTTARVDQTCTGGFCVYVVDDRPDEVVEEKDAQ